MVTISDPKSSDARARFGYLLQQLTEDYDKKASTDKRKHHTLGSVVSTYILVKYYQLDLKTMLWVEEDQLSKFLLFFN